MKALERILSGNRRRVMRFVALIRKRGVRRTLGRLSEELDDLVSRKLHGLNRYERWFGEQQRASAASFGDADEQGPLISVVMPVCDPALRWLDAAIDSVRAQLYLNWELCIVDDASCDLEVRRVLTKAANQDNRIHQVRNVERQGIARSTNRAVEAATGEYVAFLDHDDEFTPDALMCVARYARDESFDILYSDEDKIDRRGHLRDPTFKPDRSRELLHACMYFGHLCVYRREFLLEVGGFDADFDGGQDYDLALRAERQADRVVHAPVVLYHWRMAVGSAANPDEDAKPWAYEAGRRAIKAEVARQSGQARVVDGVRRGHARVVRVPPQGTTMSVLYCECCRSPELPVPEGSERDLRGAEVGNSTPNVEWVSMLTDPDSQSDLGLVGARWNEAAARAAGEVLIFLDGVRPFSPPGTSSWNTWWEELASQAMRESVGAVGVRVRSSSKALLHMGAVLGGPEVVRTRTAGLRADEPGHLALAQSLREVAAVSGGCLAIRRDLFMHFGGFDRGFRSSLHDVDFCMRLRESGLRILYDPYVECEIMDSHHRHIGFSCERLSQPSEGDLKRLLELRRDELREADPYSNPNFHVKGAIFNPCHRSEFER